MKNMNNYCSIIVRIIQDYSGLFRIIQDYQEPSSLFCTIQDYAALLKITKNYSTIILNIE